MLISAGTYLDALFLLLGDNSDRSKGLVRELIDAAERNAGKREIITPDDDLIDTYKALIKRAINENISQENGTAAKMLLLQLKSNEVIKQHPVVLDVLTDVLMNVEKISVEQIDSYLRSIRSTLIINDIDATTKKVFTKVRQAAEIKDAEMQEHEILRLRATLDEGLKALDNRFATVHGKKSESYVSLSDKESIRKSFEIYVERSVAGVIKTGLLGINRALGERGGMGRGEAWAVAALSHHYKSGFLLSCLIWGAAYNKHTVKPGMRPLIYFVSVENEVMQNLAIIFRSIYTRVEQKPVNLKTMDLDFITTWLHNYFSQFGVEVIIDRYTPHEFTFGKFVARRNEFADQGLEMVEFILDYLGVCRGIDPGDNMSPNGKIQLIDENYSKFCNDAKSVGYLFITGHQLTKDASRLAAQDRYAVKKFEASLMADSPDVYRHLDGLFFLHLSTNIDGVKFLLAQLRKDRGSQNTPENHKFCAYPFTENGIVDDIDTLPGWCTDIDGYGFPSATHDDNALENTLF